MLGNIMVNSLVGRNIHSEDVQSGKKKKKKKSCRCENSRWVVSLPKGLPMVESHLIYYANIVSAYMYVFEWGTIPFSQQGLCPSCAN